MSQEAFGCLDTELVGMKHRPWYTPPEWEGGRNFLLQPFPVAFDLSLDAGFAHDPGAIESVAQANP